MLGLFDESITWNGGNAMGGHSPFIWQWRMEDIILIKSLQKTKSPWHPKLQVRSLSRTRTTIRDSLLPLAERSEGKPGRRQRSDSWPCWRQYPCRLLENETVTKKLSKKASDVPELEVSPSKVGKANLRLNLRNRYSYCSHINELSYFILISYCCEGSHTAENNTSVNFSEINFNLWYDPIY